ncbi:M29 family metallopeptidase [Neobacillus vireti]|uniref:Leucyl aminopeptidase (Aminopeptidase T) n=1 Tax=Neobacillus vireti LMG 21834 TaxID=1131730 RepID=A0AB94IR75_9BACI|nr:leucyl aminopeptidase (aminopeptidase T) [Neobacillus vireti]ETI69458.1 leucyl aminopeptidase (aminopeptidase T) [Neobacillus vireti LMG 21834]KLT18923.1 leucyl aminopeptidase [Neobacillus vireti]
MAQFLDMELTKSAYKLMHDMVKVKPGESVLVTLDSIGDFRVAEEIVKMADALGAKAMLAWHSTPKGYGALTMEYLPEPLKECVDKTDVWIELNDQWLLYSPIWDKAVTNGRTRQVMLGGLGIERIVRNIGLVDMKAQNEFQTRLTQLTKEASEVRITNKAGTDVTFQNDPNRPINNEIDYSTPGAHFLIGQIGWAPIEGSINGRIAFDGALSGGGDLELGVLRETITYVVEKGRIVEFEGGALAKRVKDYFASLNDPNMYIAAHVCYGCSPNAKLEGCTTEDERIWGSTEWGFGHQGPNYSGGAPRVAKSHVDGISLACSVWLDGQLILDNGIFIHPDLAKLAKKLGK